MEQKAIFEEKVALLPKDMNRIGKETIDSILLEYLKKKLEKRCSQHGFVVSDTLTLLSRSMGQLENGRFTGNVIYYVQAEAIVYAPYNGMRIRARVEKKNKMGLYLVYRNSIRILVPRDLHLGSEEFEAIQPQEEIEVELRKSRFQIHDPFILSVGVLVKRGLGDAIPVQTTYETNDSSSEPESNSESNSNTNVSNQEQAEESDNENEINQENVEEESENEELNNNDDEEA